MSKLKGRLPEFLIFNSNKWSLLNETKTFPVSAITTKRQYTRKEIVTKLRTSNTMNPLTSLSSVLPILHDATPRNYGCSSQSYLWLSLEKHLSRWGWISSSPNWQWRHTFSAQPHSTEQRLCQSSKPVQIVEFLMNLKRFLSLNIFPFV